MSDQFTEIVVDSQFDYRQDRFVRVYSNSLQRITIIHDCALIISKLILHNFIKNNFVIQIENGKIFNYQLAPESEDADIVESTGIRLAKAQVTGYSKEDIIEKLTRHIKKMKQKRMIKVISDSLDNPVLDFRLPIKFKNEIIYSAIEKFYFSLDPRFQKVFLDYIEKNQEVIIHLAGTDDIQKCMSDINTVFEQFSRKKLKRIKRVIVPSDKTGGNWFSGIRNFFSGIVKYLSKTGTGKNKENTESLLPSETNISNSKEMTEEERARLKEFLNKARHKSRNIKM